MDKLILSEYGTAGKIYALGVQGSDRFRELTENLLVNYGVIDYEKAKFHQLTPAFGYFVIDINKFRKALEEYFENVLRSDKIGKPSERKGLAIQKAEEYIGEIEIENFMKYEQIERSGLANQYYAYQHSQS